jgi:HEAT repeat protein
VIRACLPLVTALACFAAQPRFENGKVETRAGAFEPLFHEIVAAASGPVWIAYSEPAAPGRHDMCSQDKRTAVMLEGSNSIVVLYRVEQHAVQRVQIATEDCAIDAGGLTVYWLENVPASQSVAMLASLVQVKGSAVTALALHADASAVTTLVRLAREYPEARVRKNALFWLAQVAQHRISEEEIQRAIASDPEADVKRAAVFALSRLPADEGVPKLIELAESNRNPVVRKQAMFWLGQSRDARALDFFARVLGK